MNMGNMGNTRQQQQQDLRSGRPGGSTSSDEFARSYEYLTGRMRDIDLKIRIILDGLQFRESQQRKIAKIDSKITQLRQQFLFLQSNKFRSLQCKLHQYFTHKESFLTSLQSQAQQLKLLHLSPKLDSQVTTYQQKLIELRRQLESTQRSIQAFETKQFKYDNFELQNLKTQLGKFQKRMTGFEEQRKNKLLTLGQLEGQLKSAIEHVRSSAIEVENKGLELEKMRRTISTKVVPEPTMGLEKRYQTLSEHRIEPLHHTTSAYQFEDYRASDYQSSVEQDDQDVFFHQKRHPQMYISANNINPNHNPNNPNRPSNPLTMTNPNPYHSSLAHKPNPNPNPKPKPPHRHNSSFQNFTEQQGSEQQILQTTKSHKLQRLIDIIQRSKRKMPLRCEIDQTGYLKFRDTGTYIFDKDGNLFEFNRQEMEEAVERRVIELT